MQHTSFLISCSPFNLKNEIYQTPQMAVETMPCPEVTVQTLHAPHIQILFHKLLLLRTQVITTLCIVLRTQVFLVAHPDKEPSRQGKKGKEKEKRRMHLVLCSMELCMQPSTPYVLHMQIVRISLSSSVASPSMHSTEYGVLLLSRVRNRLCMHACMHGAC